MIKFEDKYFVKFEFTDEQVKKYFNNALKDLNIAKNDKIPEVKFNYAYNALIKCGIALLTFYGRKVKSVPGHHVKIIEKISEFLKDGSVNDVGNLMRSKRNLDLYTGGIVVTEKESREYIAFAESVITRVKRIIS